MKKLISISYLLFSVTISFGQSDQYEEIFKDPEFSLTIKYLAEGKFDSCLSTLSKFDTSDSKYYSVALLKSQCHWETRNFKELKKDFDYIIPRTSKKDPNYSNLLNLYGLSLKNTGNKEKAIKVFKDGYELTNDAILLVNLTSTYNQLKKYNESIKYEELLYVDTIGNLHFYVGEAFYKLKKDEQAEEYLLKYINNYNLELQFHSYLYLGYIKKRNHNPSQSCDFYNRSHISLEKIPNETRTKSTNINYSKLTTNLEKELSKCNK